MTTQQHPTAPPKATCNEDACNDEGFDSEADYLDHLADEHGAEIPRWEQE